MMKSLSYADISVGDQIAFKAIDEDGTPCDDSHTDVTGTVVSKESRAVYLDSEPESPFVFHDESQLWGWPELDPASVAYRI